MTVLIYNQTDEMKSIQRFNGTKLHILPNNFITFECTSVDEVKYWGVQSTRNLNNIGIRVIIDLGEIRLLQKLKQANRLPAHKVGSVETANSVKVDEKCSVDTVITEVNTETEVVSEGVFNSVETVSDDEKLTEAIVDDTTETDADTDNDENIDIIDNNIEVVNDDNTVQITADISNAEYLATLDKAELQKILDDMNVSYKKNNSVNTLITLILENQ